MPGCRSWLLANPCRQAKTQDQVCEPEYEVTENNFNKKPARRSLRNLETKKTYAILNDEQKTKTDLYKEAEGNSMAV